MGASQKDGSVRTNGGKIGMAELRKEKIKLENGIALVNVSVKKEFKHDAFLPGVRTGTGVNGANGKLLLPALVAYACANEANGPEGLRSDMAKAILKADAKLPADERGYTGTDEQKMKRAMRQAGTEKSGWRNHFSNILGILPYGAKLAEARKPEVVTLKTERVNAKSSYAKGEIFKPADSIVPQVENPEKSIENEDFESGEKEAQSLSLPELRKKALDTESQKPASKDVPSKQFERSPYIVEYVKGLANGICQLCNQKAPFEKRNLPYLEVHHIKWLAEGGPDAVNNTVALCPNCHRKMHVLGLNEDVNKLLKVTENRA